MCNTAGLLSSKYIHIPHFLSNSHDIYPEEKSSINIIFLSMEKHRKITHPPSIIKSIREETMFAPFPLHKTKETMFSSFSLQEAMFPSFPLRRHFYYL